MLRPDLDPTGALRARLTHRVPAISSILDRIAASDRVTFEHALATGALAGRIAARMRCSRSDIADAASVGMLHEAGVVEVPQLTEAEVLRASASELFEASRRERAVAVAIVRADERIADLAELVGRHFDDIARGVVTRIVVVADVYDYLTRAWPHRRGLPGPDALRILSEVAGVRYPQAVVAALSATLYDDDGMWHEGPGA